MGCGISKDVSKISPNLVVVGGFLHEQNDHSSRIDVYSLKRIGFLNSLELPSVSTSGSLKQGYSIANDGKNPILYITGGCYGNSDTATNLAWKLDVSASEDDVQYELLPNMPVCMSGHRSTLVSNDTDCLYVSDGKSVYCLNLTSKRWSALPSLPSPLTRIEGLLNGGNHLYLVGDGKLMSYPIAAAADDKGEEKNASTNGNKASWKVEQESGFPVGKTVILGKEIFIQVSEEKILYKYNTESKTSGKAKGMDTLHMQNNAIATLGDSFIYFIGGRNVDTTKNGLKDVVEYSASKNRFAVAGYLKDCVEESVACFYVDAK